MKTPSSRWNDGMRSFLETVADFGRKENLWQPGDRILAAVSGGPDSLALLLALYALSQTEKFSVFCCTVNHRLRPEAAEETSFVSRVASELGVPCLSENADVPAYRKLHGGSVETVARILRYEALARAAEKFRCDTVALAHHRDDQAETVLLHLLRGSGLTGLCGMTPRRDSRIRPFLCVTKREIGEFLKNFPYTACHDATNDETIATRNRVRLELLPMLSTYNPQITEALCRTAETLALDDGYLEAAVAEAENQLREETGCLSIKRETFRAIPEALQRRLLRRIWRRLSGKLPEHDAAERLIAFLRHAENGKKTSAAGVVAEISKGKIYFYPGSTRAGTKRIIHNAQCIIGGTPVQTI